MRNRYFKCINNRMHEDSLAISKIYRGHYVADDIEDWIAIYEIGIFVLERFIDVTDIMLRDKKLNRIGI